MAYLNDDYKEIDVNKKNREEYENLMNNSKTKLDTYYDKNNIFVKIVLFLLLAFIIFGVVYYLIQYLNQ